MPRLPDSRRTRAALALGGAVLMAAVLAACAGSDDDGSAAQDVPRVGLMHVGTDHIPPSWPSLKGRLEELGWTDGQNIELMWRNLEPDEAEAQADVFVGQDVDVIVAFEDTSISAAQEATAGTSDPIPIVFLHPSDPVRDGLVDSLARPDRNLTGVYAARDVVAKQLELYELLVPRLRRVLTLVDPDDPNTERLLTVYQAASAQLPRPLELDIREASNAKNLRRIFQSLRPGEVDGAFLLSPSLRLNHSTLTIRLAERARIPVQAHRKEWVEEGALYSYGIDLPLIGRAGARYVDSLLRGTSPAELPVQEISKIELAINLGTAARLGIKVPQEMIIRADEVYRGGT
ncbi:MAG: ABC transporter substrate-binding protein [Actinobacteria bacterium]|nr:ABC transporter substrate-binding protein [Actinomycetota bacterium]